MSVSSSPTSATGPIFLITHEFYPVRGGIATFTEEIAKATAGLGYEVEVWAQSAPPQIEKPWPFRLRRLPLRFIVTAARAGLAESLSNETRRATLIAGAATGVMALIRRWRRRSHRPGSGAPGTDSEGAAHDES